MPVFGLNSLAYQETLHADLVLVLDAVMAEATEEGDFAIIDGLRNKLAQDVAYRNKKSKAVYPMSYHNGSVDDKGDFDFAVSDAADCVPYPIEWPDKKHDLPHEYVRKMKRFYDLAERILTKAYELGIEIEWGGMFKSFFDGVHFQRKRS